MNEKIVFAGGTDWSVEFLDLLRKEGFSVIGVLTPPDSPKDRGLEVKINPLKLRAKKLNIPVWQPDKLDSPEFLAEFKKISPDLVVVVAYGKLFPPEILAIPPLGFINFHPSLLPKLRGPSPIQSAILEGFKETGVSIMKLGKGMDDGPILAQERIKINPRETAGTLTWKLTDMGKKLLPNVLKKYLVGTRRGAFERATGTFLQKQNENQATYCNIIRKEAGKINWQKESAEIIDRKVRALNLGIKVYTFLTKNGQKKRVNILESAGIIGKQDIRDLPISHYQLFAKNNKKYLAVKAQKGILLVNRLQVESKKSISAEDFFQGYKEGKFSS